MLIIRKNTHEWLFDELKVYSTLPVYYQNCILYVAFNNLCRSFINQKNSVVLNKILLDFRMNIKNPFAVENLKANMQESLNISISKDITINNWEQLEELYLKSFDKIKKENKLICSMAFIYNLYKNGMCPFLLYAFDSWQYDETIENIIEFSLVYLYKIVPYCYEKNNNYLKISQEGATSNIFLNEKNNVLYKIPKNYATYKFLLQQEYENVLELKNTKLSKYLADEYVFTSKHILMHKNVNGENGIFFLEHYGKLDKMQKKDLRDFYLYYINRKNKEIILDIHPGNFVWEKSKKQWFLIDVGALPIIGKEYYEYSSFELYYQKIWLSRQECIKRYPIRSIDYSISHG